MAERQKIIETNRSIRTIKNVRTTVLLSPAMAETHHCVTHYQNIMT